MWDGWFPTIGNRVIAMKCARHGAIGAVIFAASYVLGAAYTFFGSVDVSTGQPMSADDVLTSTIGSVVVVPIVLIAAWRISIGKEWLVAGFLMVLFLLEIAMKVVGGTTNIGWMIAYVAVGTTIVNGIRGCWWVRANPNSELTTTGVEMVNQESSNNLPYVVLENGRKRYTRATVIDILFSLLLPFWGIVIGGVALAKGEQKRGLTMAGIGAVLLALVIATRI